MSIKHCLRGLVVVLGLLVPSSLRLAVGQQAERAFLKQEIALLAATSAAGQVIQSLDEDADRILQDSANVDATLKGRLTKEMLNDVVTHSDRAGSLSLADALLRAAITERIELELTRICKTRKVAFEDFKGRFGDYKGRVSSAVSGHVDKVKYAYFNGARRDAVAKIAETMDLRIQYPPVYEADKYVVNWNVMRRELIKHLQESAIPPGRPAFEENKETAKTTATNIANNIHLEYENQKKELATRSADDAVPHNLITAKAIEDFVRKKVYEYLEREDREGVPSYRDPFPCLSDVPASNAAALESKRLDDHLKECEFSFRGDSLRHVFRSLAGCDEKDASGASNALKAHETFQGSRDLIAAHLRDGTEEYLIHAYLQTRGSDVSDELTAYFTGLLGDQGRHDIVLNRLKAVLDSELPPIREEFAKEQIAKYHKTLPQWTPEEEQVSRVYDYPLTMPSTYDAARQLLGPDNEARPDLIEEAQRMVRDQVKQRLGGWRDSLRAQLNIVTDVEDDRCNQLERQVLAGEDRSKQDFVDEWTADFRGRWEQQKENSDAFQGTPIFRRTEKEILEKVSQLYDSFEAQRIAAEKAAEAQRLAMAEATAAEAGKGSPASNVRENESVAAPNAVNSHHSTTDGTATFGSATFGGTRTPTSGGSGTDRGPGGGKEGEKDGDGGTRDRAGAGRDVTLDIVLLVRRESGDASGTSNDCVATIEGDSEFCVAFSSGDIDETVHRLCDNLRMKVNDVLDRKLKEASGSVLPGELVFRFRWVNQRGSGVPLDTAIEFGDALAAICNDWHEKRERQGRDTPKPKLHWSQGHE